MEKKVGSTVSIVLLGETKVGKTALIRRFDNDTFTPEFYSTLGTDFIMKDMSLGGDQVQAQIWDTAGQERFMTITKSFYQKADGILLVYSMEDRSSYEKLHVWANSIHTNTSERVPKYLVANKADLVEDRKVTREEGEAIAKQYVMSYVEASAKTKLGVKEVFEGVIGQAWEVKKSKTNSPSLVLRNKEKVAKKNGCC